MNGNPIDVLCDYKAFMPRCHCGPGWTPLLQWTYITANLLISLSYLGMGLLLIMTVRRKVKILAAPVYSWHSLLWGSFIVACGVGHTLENVGAFWYPAYRLFALWHLITAFISALTLITFVPVAKWLVKQARLAELEQLEHGGTIETPSQQVRRMTHEIE